MPRFNLSWLYVIIAMSLGASHVLFFALYTSTRRQRFASKSRKAASNLTSQRYFWLFQKLYSSAV